MCKYFWYIYLSVLKAFVNTLGPRALSYRLSLCAAFGQTVTFGDGQDGVVTASAVGAQDRNTERLRLHSGTAHTLLLYSRSLQGVRGFTATFSLRDEEMFRKVIRISDPF